MKIVKYFFLLSLLAIITFSVYVATQDSKIDIQRSKVIKAPRTLLFHYVNDYKNWERWQLWENEESKIEYTYSNQTSGLGASYSWINKNGIGKMETVYVKDNDSLAQRLLLNETISNIYWKFKDTLGGTKVTWRLKGELSFALKAYAFFKGDIQDNINPIFEKGLNRLDAQIIAELNNYSIEVNGPVLRNGSYFLQQAASCNILDLKRKEGIIFNNMIIFFKKNNIPMAGAPFSIYHLYDTKHNAVTFSAAVPIAEQIITADDSDYTTGELPEFWTLKTTLKGDYSHGNEAWDKAYEYLDNPINKIAEAPGNVIEVFVRGPWDTHIPSEWITEIYIPIQKKTITSRMRPAIIHQPDVTADLTTP